MEDPATAWSLNKTAGPKWRCGKVPLPRVAAFRNRGRPSPYPARQGKPKLEHVELLPTSNDDAAVQEASTRSQDPLAPQLNQADIDEFKEIIWRARGVRLDNGDAWGQVTELMSLFRLVHQPPPHPWVPTSSRLPH